MLFEDQEIIGHKLINQLNSYFDQSWAMLARFSDPTIRKLLSEDAHWIKVKDYNDLATEENFLFKSSLPVLDPFDISTYHGFVFLSPLNKKDRDKFQKAHPGVILIDNAFYNYADDKYKMTNLLMEDPITQQHKPKWGLYQRDDPNLAERINAEIGSEIYVIKPTNQFCGQGVIIVQKEALKEVLEYIFDASNMNISIEDSAYEYWKKHGKANKFIVEEFCKG